MARLLACDREDLETIAALLQDSLLRACDTHYDGRRRILSLLVNRYRWEVEAAERCHTILRIHGVIKAQRRSWPDSRAAVLELLHIEGDDDLIEMVFAGGTSVRCRVEAIDMLLEDVGDPWPASARPGHDDDEDPSDGEDGSGDDAAGPSPSDMGTPNSSASPS